MTTKSLSRPKAVLYDMDGTIIDTDALHVEAWQHAGKLFDFNVTAEQLSQLKGLSSQKTLEAILPKERHDIIQSARDVKQNYFQEHLRDVQFLGEFEEAYRLLTEGDIAVGVCTSAPQMIVDRLLSTQKFSFLNGKIAYKEMFPEGKPSAAPLYTALNLLRRNGRMPGGINVDDAVYVGDGHADYGSATNAGMRFFYFCPEFAQRDARIPEEVPVLANHLELLRLFD